MTFVVILVGMEHDIVRHSSVYWQAFVCKQVAFVQPAVEHHMGGAAFEFEAALQGEKYERKRNIFQSINRTQNRLI